MTWRRAGSAEGQVKGDFSERGDSDWPEKKREKKKKKGT
jgi:hypothetical protein